MVICHALTGSADVEDWWGPLLGPGKAFDPTRYFIFCANVIGSPYGTVSSVTLNPETGKKWGPELTGSSVKDDVRRVSYDLVRRSMVMTRPNPITRFADYTSSCSTLSVSNRWPSSSEVRWAG